MSCAVKVCAAPLAVLSYAYNGRNETTVSASNSAGIGKNVMETFRLLKLVLKRRKSKEHKCLSSFQKFKSGAEDGECSEYPLMAKQLNLWSVKGPFSKNIRIITHAIANTFKFHLDRIRVFLKII
jgi:hypothetical protein